MKKTFLILFVAFAQLIVSCSTEDDGDTPQDPIKEKPDEEEPDNEDETETDSVTIVSFKFQGDFKASESTQQQQDLFGIQVYDVEEGEPYAYVLADKSEGLALEVESGKTYRYVTTYVRNAKGLLEKENGRWLQPFSLSNANAPQINSFVYASSSSFAELATPEVAVAGEERQTYLPIDRYHSLLETSHEAETATLNLDLKRMVFGIEFEVDLGEGSLIEEVVFRVNPSEGFPQGQQHLIGLEDGKGFLEVPYLSLAVPEGNLNEALEEDYTENVLVSLGTLEEPERFAHAFLMMSRNKLLEIKFASEEGHPNLNFQLEEGELLPEDGSLYEY